MKAVYAVIALIWVGSFVGAQRLALPQTPSRGASSSAEITRPVRTPIFTPIGEVIPVPPVEPDDSHETRTDLLGNEIEHAVADYRIDRGGAVYERHSPETAVPRMGSPTS